MKWYNASTGVTAACEQLEPVLLNGKIQRGRRNGEFIHEDNGRDILHRVVPGQIQVEDDDPRVRPAGR